MRRNLVIWLMATGFIFSCSTEKQEPIQQKSSQHDEEQEFARKTADTLEQADTLTNRGRVTMASILDAFIYCKETAETPLQCKHFVAKAIHDYFGVKDFMLNGNYVDFENILFMVRSNTRWQSLGLARDQETLDKAQQLANLGRPVLAIQTNSQYGHIVIVMPGQLQAAPNWGGLKCPVVASFFMVDDLDSFVDRNMAFAWSSPEGIEIFARQ